MNEVEDDSWVREFDVSNPQKTHAGYTVYRVSSKVYPKGFPEGASEVIVFKRYSEIRALYKELKIIYESKNVEKKKFPRFAKGHYFDRFDESVIEERQKQALSLLLFAGNIAFLFTSQPFVKFFEGGVEHSSRGSSYSDTEQTTADTSSETQTLDDTNNETWTPEIYFSENQDSSDDETIYERDLSNKDLSFNKTEDDKTWLSRAMSLCSEGDDIEILASQAGYITNNDHSSEPDNLLSQGSLDMLPTLLESDNEHEGEEDVFVEIISPQNTNHSENNSPQDPEEIICARKLENIEQISGSCLKEEIESSLPQPLDSRNISSTPDNYEEDIVPTDVVSLMLDRNETMNTCKENKGNRIETNSTEDTIPAHKQVGHAVSNIAMSWIDPKKKDYLYQAAQIIQQALYCEANEMYEEAFNKYKICVGILLNGVQHDNDSKRREAVRRKTAQYLVKAEFLFNTYLKHDDIKDWSIQPQNSCQDITQRNIVDRQFGHLTLATLKVIGVIDKNMLVQCKGLDGVYVIKALHKTNAVHRSGRQENKQTNKSFSKKYVKSTRMVKLHRHFETNDSIFLLLEYAAGGCLWNHVKSFRQRFNQDTSGDIGLSNDTSGVLQPASGTTSGVLQPASSTTSVDETTPKCPLECSDGGGSTRKEIIENKFSRERILNPLKGLSNSETRSLNSLCCSKDGISSFSSHTPTMKKSNTDISTAENDTSREHYKQTTCLTGQITCLNQSREKCSFEGEDNETGKTCSTSCGDVLGFLDHVTKDYSAMDKCIQHWIAELLLAINSVHLSGIILKDLKPSNVLLDGNGHVKLSYFGVWEDVDHSLDPEAVQQFYCAPEVSRCEKITFAADWWSLGVLSYELITRKTLCSTHPWGIYPHSSIIFPSQDISMEAKSFLSGLICHNARERLGSAMDGMEGIKSHAFFQGVDWNELAKSS